MDPNDRLTDEGSAFLAERHLASFTTSRGDGSPHVTPVGFTWDAGAGLARVITSGGSRKAVHLRTPGRVALCQLDGRRWLTLEGVAHVETDPAAVADAEARYTVRYRPPRLNPARVVVVVEVTRIIGARVLVTPASPGGGPARR